MHMHHLLSEYNFLRRNKVNYTYELRSSKLPGRVKLLIPVTAVGHNPLWQALKNLSFTDQLAVKLSFSVKSAGYS